jgi:hypothetical protein
MMTFLKSSVRITQKLGYWLNSNFSTSALAKLQRGKKRG